MKIKRLLCRIFGHHFYDKDERGTLWEWDFCQRCGDPQADNRGF